MSGEGERPEVVARGDGVLGEVVLRRHGTVYELIVNGVFLMDTAATSTEELLAEAVLDRHAAPRRILVGGLGLGFTTAALLHDPRVERIDVVEIEPLLVDWLRAGLVPKARAVVDDPRVDVQVTDLRDALAGADPVYDAILIDVDNGPDFLVSGKNAPLYEPPALAAAVAALTSTGMLAVWSSHRSPRLRAALETVCDSCDETPVEIVRDNRPLTYFLYTAARDQQR
jgi:spermidine synthase